jgi:DNA-binding LytR/AlgR family response regulator
MFHLQTIGGKRHIIDYTLDQLERMIDPDCFFRINRKIITNICAIKKIHTYFNSRLLLELHPKINLKVIVSRERVGDFKGWLDK